ncbi:MAG: NAD-dependent dihydropyrimidine dehydrogenase subunit PreA [Peptococcaceae bacterium]|nr:NAD-dependent dihydropyrimidine dehydrogenase subunit PreA [Peptococcaceae bacterium]
MTIKPDLSVEFCGLKFPNFMVLASAPPTGSGPMIRRAFEKGWGGAVTKTIKTDSITIKDVSPRFAALKDGSGEVFGFENFELVTPKPLAYWTTEIAATKEQYPDRVLIGSIMAELTRDKWQALALAVEKAGADAIELNLSCPHGMPEQGLGHAMGQNPEITAMVVGWVKEAVKIPVIAKLSPNVTDITPIVKAAEKAGADGISAINTVQCLLGLDLNTMLPIPTVGAMSTFGGYSGEAVRPIGLRIAAQVAGCSNLPLMGIGGISKWDHAAEYILLGASAVQVCTAVMLKGYGMVRKVLTGMEKYLAEKGLQSVSELRGRALPFLTSHENLSHTHKVAPSFDGEACQRCGACVVACRDGGHQALSVTEDFVPKVDVDTCDGCALCSLACKTGCITMMVVRD